MHAQKMDRMISPQLEAGSRLFIPTKYVITQITSRFHSNLIKVWSTGRGGAGNVRSPSRDPVPAVGPDVAEQEVIRQEAQREVVSVNPTSLVFTIEPFLFSSLLVEGESVRSLSLIHLPWLNQQTGNMSRSRSRSRGPMATPAVHSTGRGGLGNFKAGEEPSIEEVAHHDSGV